MSDAEPPELGDVMEFPDEQRDDEYRWIVLFEEDYENVAIDVDSNVGVKVDIAQTGELMRLAAESLAALSHRDAVGDDVLRDMAERLAQEADRDARARRSRAFLDRPVVGRPVFARDRGAGVGRRRRRGGVAGMSDGLSHLAPERRQQCVFLAKKWKIPRGEALILLESAAETRPAAEGEYAN